MPVQGQLITRSIYVDIGDCRVDFLGGNDLLSPKSMLNSPIHLHTKPELQYIVSGTLEENIEGSPPLTIPKGSILLIPPNLLHSNEKQEGSRMIFTFALQQIPLNPDEYSFSEYQYYSGLFGQIHKPIVYESSALSYCLTQLTTLSDAPQNRHKQKSLLSFFFIQLCQEVQLRCQSEAVQNSILPGSRYNQQYFLVEHYINTHYNKKTSTENIAAILHISRRQADRIVEQSFGKSYAALITERRMSIAKVLLEKTALTCSEIAEKVGYDSYPGFFLAFKQFFGIAPDALRKCTTEK